MTISQGSRLQVAFAQEAIPGTAMTTLAILPINPGNSLALTKDNFVSEQVRADRQTADMRHGAKQAGGDIPVPFKYTDFDPLLEGALFGSWVTNTSSITHTTVNATADEEFVTDDSWADLALAAGDYVGVSGFVEAANNGVFRVLTATATTLTVELGALTVEAAGEEVTVEKRETLSNGTTEKTFTIEEGYLDIGQYHRFVGMRVSSWNLGVPPNGMVTCGFSWLGENMTTSTTALDDAITDESGNECFSGIDAGIIYEGGSVIAVVTNADITLDNGLNPVFVVGSPSVKTVTAGRCQVSGTLSVLFQDSVMLNKFLNETESSLWLVLSDPDGNKISIDLPRIKYSGGSPEAAGENEFILSMPFQALMDATLEKTIILSRGQ